MDACHKKSDVRGILWIAIYVLLVLLPLLILIFDDTSRPPGTSFLWDFSIGLGLSAASLIHLMAVLTARFRYFSAPFGIDVLYYFHRLMAVLIFVLVIAHPALLFVEEPLIVYKFSAPGQLPMLAGVAALLSVVVLVITALARRLLHVDYDNWRRFHVVFGSLALVFSFSHMGLVDYYTDSSQQFVVWSLYAVAWFALFLYVRVIKPFALLRKPYELTGIQKERGDTYTLKIAPVGHAGLRFLPGQFAWLSINRSPFALSDHPFSFSGSAQSTDTLSFTIKGLGDFTRTIKNLPYGARVHVDGPFGVFSTDSHYACGYVFIAGGIGIAPIMSILRTLAGRKDNRPLKLFYANKSPDTAIFYDELLSLENQLDLSVVHIFTDPPDSWSGESGLVDEHVLAHHLTGDYCQWDYFICGPVPMMKLVESSLYNLGVPYRQVHTEIYNLV